MTVVNKTRNKIAKITKRSELIKILQEYIFTGIPTSQGDNLNFSIVDYFCLTDIVPSDLLAHIRRGNFEIDSIERTILCKFLSQYSDLGETMTVAQLKSEHLRYIIKGKETVITEENWTDILTSFNALNIPTKRLVVDVAARKIAYGECIFPLLDASKTASCPLQYRKSK